MYEAGWTPTQISGGAGVVELDMADPSAPVQTTTRTSPAMLSPHESLVLHDGRGLSLTPFRTLDDLAPLDGVDGDFDGGLTILDVSSIRDRDPTPRPPVKLLAGDVGHPGAARIIDIGDEAAPEVVSNIRLTHRDPAVRSTDGVLGDPGAQTVYKGYAAHYCQVDRRTDPRLLACSMIQSGLRVFDIRTRGSHARSPTSTSRARP